MPAQIKTQKSELCQNGGEGGVTGHPPRLNTFRTITAPVKSRRRSLLQPESKVGGTDTSLIYNHLHLDFRSEMERKKWRERGAFDFWETLFAKYHHLLALDQKKSSQKHDSHFLFGLEQFHFSLRFDAQTILSPLIFQWFRKKNFRVPLSSNIWRNVG